MVKLLQAARDYIKAKKQLTVCMQKHFRQVCHRCKKYAGCPVYGGYCIAWTELQRTVKKTENDLIERAWKFAQEKHKGQLRDEGDPYEIHPKAVASYLAGLEPKNKVLIAAAYLHDTIEDTETTFEELKEEFGIDVAITVQQLTFYREKGETFEQRSTRMADELADARWEARVIKLADRLHNLRTMYAWPEWKQKRYRKATRYLIDKLSETNTWLERQIVMELAKERSQK